MEAIVQGPIYNETKEIVNNLLQTSFVNRVIVSCWESCPKLQIDDSRIFVVRNVPHENPGILNRNLQIQSSFAGVKEVKEDFCAKFRTDQIISLRSLELMNRFAIKFQNPKICFEDGSFPKSQMFVCGDHFPFPFHPRDHIFWSNTESLKKLFDIPYDTNEKIQSENWKMDTRAETYICSYYYSLFNSKVLKMIKNPEEYLCDGSPKKQEALEISSSLHNKVFQIFPRIEVRWPRHGHWEYPYHIQSSFERWHETSWE